MLVERADNGVGQRDERFGRLAVDRAGRPDEIAREIDAQNLSAAIGQDDEAHHPSFAQHEQFGHGIIDALDHGPALYLARIFLQSGQRVPFLVGQGHMLCEPVRETTCRHPQHL